MIHIAVCDDDVATTGIAEKLILNIGLSLQQKIEVTVFFSGEDFCAYLNRSDDIFDIVLMDIEMGDISGVDAGRKLRESAAYNQTFLIYISSHSNYYKEIIDLNVFSFIPKPFKEAEFNLKLTKAIEMIEARRFATPVPDFAFESKGDKLYIPMKSIMYLESSLRKIILHTTVGKKSYYGSLDAAQEQLPERFFCRINRSCIVCFAHMTQITSRYVTISGQTLNISSTYRESTKLAYARYRGG